MDSRQRANLVESLPGHVSITYASEGYVRRRRSPYRRICDNVLYLNYLFLPLFPLQTLSFVKGLILRFHGFLSPFLLRSNAIRVFERMRISAEKRLIGKARVRSYAKAKGRIESIGKRNEDWSK